MSTMNKSITDSTTVTNEIRNGTFTDKIETITVLTNQTTSGKETKTSKKNLDSTTDSSSKNKKVKGSNQYFFIHNSNIWCIDCFTTRFVFIHVVNFSTDLF